MTQFQGFDGSDPTLLVGCWGMVLNNSAEKAVRGKDYLHIPLWLELNSICTSVSTNPLCLKQAIVAHRTGSTKGKGKGEGNQARVFYPLFAIVAMECSIEGID